MDDATSIDNYLNEPMASENQLNRLEGEKNKNVATKRRPGIRKMWLAACAALSLCFTIGLSTGYSAPATYDMQHRKSSVIKPTEKEVMWIGSILALGGVLGCLIAGPMADILGRKKTLVYNLLPHGSSWIIIYYAESIPIILLGRFISGVAIGIISSVVPMYCVEIATVEVRGILGSACQGFLVIGNFLSVIIGAYISWNHLALNGAVLSILAVILFFPMPETPRWLLMKNKLPDAIKITNYLQGGFVNAEKECEAIYEDLQNQPKGRVTWKELMHPTCYKPAIICLFIMFFQHFSGINAVFLYSSNVFVVSRNFLDPKVSTIILGSVQVIATVLSNVTVDKAGRKLLLIFSGSIMGISFTVFGGYYYKISADQTIEESYGWIPLLCCIIAVIGYSIGYGPLPFLLPAEMVSIRVRSTITAVTHFANGMFGFIVLNTFTNVEGLLKKYGTFWFYSSLSAVGVVFVMLFVPETKGKTMDEIQANFDKTRNKKNEQIIIAAISYRVKPENEIP